MDTSIVWEGRRVESVEGSQGALGGPGLSRVCCGGYCSRSLAAVVCPASKIATLNGGSSRLHLRVGRCRGPRGLVVARLEQTTYATKRDITRPHLPIGLMFSQEVVYQSVE